MKRLIALLLAIILIAGVLPANVSATEQEFVNVQLILNEKPKQFKVIGNGSELMFSGQDLAAMGGYEYRIEKRSAYFTRGIKTIRVDLEKNELYPLEGISKLSVIELTEKVIQVDGVYYFPGSEMLPWLNVNCFMHDGQLNIQTDEVSIWELIPEFAPEDFEFDFTACCKELGVNSKYLKARAFFQDEGLTGMFFEMIPYVGDSMDYYDLFEDIIQDQSASEKEMEDLLQNSEDVSYWMELAEDFDVIEDLPDELRLFGVVADVLSNNAISFSFELASYVKHFSMHNENILAALHAMRVDYGESDLRLPSAAEHALREIEENYTDYYSGIADKMVRAITETTLEGLMGVPSGLYKVAIKLVGFAEATSPDWDEGINRISSYDAIARYCIGTYEGIKEQSWASSIRSTCGLAYMYLYSCEQNWYAMAKYAEKEEKLALVEKYEAMAESAENWQRKFMKAESAAMNDSHEYEVVDGSMKQAYTNKLKKLFDAMARKPYDVSLNELEDHLSLLNSYFLETYGAIVDWTQPYYRIFENEYSFDNGEPPVEIKRSVPGEYRERTYDPLELHLYPVENFSSLDEWEEYLSEYLASGIIEKWREEQELFGTFELYEGMLYLVRGGRGYGLYSLKLDTAKIISSDPTQCIVIVDCFMNDEYYECTYRIDFEYVEDRWVIANYDIYSPGTENQVEADQEFISFIDAAYTVTHWFTGRVFAGATSEDEKIIVEGIPYYKILDGEYTQYADMVRCAENYFSNELIDSFVSLGYVLDIDGNLYQHNPGYGGPYDPGYPNEYSIISHTDTRLVCCRSSKYPKDPWTEKSLEEMTDEDYNTFYSYYLVELVNGRWIFTEWEENEVP